MSSLDPAIEATLAAQNSATQAQIAVALMAKQMTAAKQQGQAAVALLDAAAQMSKALGKGQTFDAVS